MQAQLTICSTDKNFIESVIPILASSLFTSISTTLYFEGQSQLQGCQISCKSMTGTEQLDSLKIDIQAVIDRCLLKGDGETSMSGAYQNLPGQSPMKSSLFSVAHNMLIEEDGTYEDYRNNRINMFEETFSKYKPRDFEAKGPYSKADISLMMGLENLYKVSSGILNTVSKNLSPQNLSLAS